jgi:hypothetical protein
MQYFPPIFVENYGNPINSVAETAAPGTDLYLNWFHLERVCCIAELAFEKVGLSRLKVAPALLKGVEPRVFAFWTSQSPEDFVIACNLGVCELIRKTVLDVGIKSLFPVDSKVMRCLHEEDVTQLSISFILITLLTMNSPTYQDFTYL